MPRVALAEDDLAAFRQRAIAAATRLFAAQGYEAVTMRAVAAELGVSAMTPYRYFEGKEALFAGVRAEAFRRFADRLEAALAARRAPLVRLRSLKQAYIAFAIDEPDAYRIMFELAQPSPAAAASATTGAASGRQTASEAHRGARSSSGSVEGNAAELAAQSQRAFATLHRTVADAVKAGVLRGDPLTIAHLVWADTHGLVSLHLAGKLAGRSLETLASVEHELAAFRPHTVPVRPRTAPVRPARAVRPDAGHPRRGS